MGSIPSKQEDKYIEEISKKYNQNKDNDDNNNNNNNNSNTIKYSFQKTYSKYDKLFFYHDLIR